MSSSTARILLLRQFQRRSPNAVVVQAYQCRARLLLTRNNNNNNNNNVVIRSFSAVADTDDKKPSLKDTVERLQKAGGTDESQEGNSPKGGDSSAPQSDWMVKVMDKFDHFKTGIAETWQELLHAGEPKCINKKIYPTETPGGDAPYTGPVNIMIIDPAEQLTAWERMQKRLTEAPIIQSILERSEEIYEKSGAKEYKKKIDHLKEDAREAWETSQNPWVYRISSVYDTVTAESPESLAVKELRKLDPEFTLEEWRKDVCEHTLPTIMSWFLEGRINQLKPWLGEGVFKRLAAEMKAREQEGVQIDTHILGIMNSEILAIEVRTTVLWVS